MLGARSEFSIILVSVCVCFPSPPCCCCCCSCPCPNALSRQRSRRGSIHPSIPGEFELVAGEERTRMMEWNADIRIPQRRDALLSSPLLSPLTTNEWMNGCMNECMYVYIHPIHPADTYEQTRQASSSPSVLEKEEKGWAPISRSLALA